MPMKLIEIYIINRALDGEDIYSLPSFLTLNGSEMLIMDVKDSLIAQQILANPTSFTMAGARLAKRISAFKEARKYVEIDGLAIGITGHDTGIMVRSHLGSYDFITVDLSDGITGIIKNKPFLVSDSDGGEKVEALTSIEEISYDELKKKYRISPHMSLNIRTADQSEDISDELIFKAAKELYLYDKKRQLLKRASISEIKQVITERMGLKG
jgi:hypothetical protein